MIPGLRDVQFELKWGASIIEFKPKITTANQIGVGDGARAGTAPRKEPITRTVTLDDERLTVNKDLHRIINACDAREEIVVDEPIFTNCEARERAIAILLDQTKQMVTAEREGRRSARPARGPGGGDHEPRRAPERHVLRDEDEAHDRRQRLHHDVHAAAASSTRARGTP